MPVPSWSNDDIYLLRLKELTTRLGEQGFTEEELQRVFTDSRVTLYPHILVNTGKGLNYMSRRFGLLTKKSIERGQKILKTYRAHLEWLEKIFGVEKEIVLAILRVETNFGGYTGSYRVFNSLLTLALAENRRSRWAEGELTELLRFSKELGLDPLSIKGSWAGAFGLCQFVPSSFGRFGVDGNGDGLVDLFVFPDAAASIANYLKHHGWVWGKKEGNQRVLFAYNHCDSYVKAVLSYASASKKQTGKKYAGRVH